MVVRTDKNTNDSSILVCSGRLRNKKPTSDRSLAGFIFALRRHHDAQQLHIKTIGVHHFDPRFNEITYKLLAVIVLGIHFGVRT
jgi:hypothetical protein